jgi:CHAT domain-containing protein
LLQNGLHIEFGLFISKLRAIYSFISKAMGRPTSVCILIFSLLFSGVLLAKDPFKKSFDKAEKNYRTGYYFKAIKDMENTIFKIKNKSLTQNQDLAFAYMRLAKYYALSAEFPSMKRYRELGVNLVSDHLQNGSPEEVRAYEYLYDFYYDYGDYKKASPAIDNAISVLQGLPEKNFYWENELLLKRLKNDIKRGFLGGQEQLADDLVKFFQSMKVDREMVYNVKKGTSKVEKLKKDEVQKRKFLAYEAINTRTSYYVQRGEYHRALDSIDSYRKNLIKEISKGSNQYVDLLGLRGLCFEGLGEPKKAYKNWENYLDACRSGGKSTYSKLSKQYFEGYEKVAINLLYNNQASFASTYIKELSNSFGLAYRYKNYYRNKVNLLLGLTDLFAGRLNAADHKFLVLLSDTLVVPMTHPERVKIEGYLYRSRLKNEKLVSALKAMVRYRIACKRLYGSHSPIYYRSGFDMANFYMNHTNGLDTAEIMFESGFKNGLDRHWSYTHDRYADYLFQYLNFLDLKDQYPRILDSLEKIKGIYDRNGWKDVAYGRILAEYSRYLFRSGDVKKGTSILDKAWVVFDELGEEKSYGFAELNLVKGELDQILGDFQGAKRDYIRSKKFANKAYTYDPFYLLETRVDVYARLLIMTGGYGEATKITDNQIKDLEKRLGSKTRLLVPAYNNKALLNLIDGDFNSAEHNYRVAEGLSERSFGHNSLKHTQSLEVGRRIFEEKGDFELASNVGKFILDIQREKIGDEHLLTATSLADLALIDYQINRRTNIEIESDLEEARETALRVVGASSPAYAMILTKSAIFYIYEDKPNRAEPYLQEAYNIWTESLGKKSLEAGEIAGIRGDLFMEKGELDKAEEQYKRAQEIFAKLFNENHPLYVKHRGKLARVYYVEGDIKSCVDLLEETTKKYLEYIEEFFPSLSEREKNKYWTMVRPDFEFFNTVACLNHEKYPRLLEDAYDYSLNTKAILLNSSIKVRQSIQNSGNATLIAKYQDWLEKKEQFTEAIGMSQEELDENEIDLEDLSEQVETLEKELGALSALFSENNKRQLFEWREIRKSLDDGEAAIEIVRFRKFHKNFTDSIFYAAYIIHPKVKGQPELVLLKNGAEMESKYFKGYRNKVKFKIPDPLSYRIFWEAIDKKLSQEISTIYLSLDGVYNQINLETLRKPDGKYVIDGRDLVLVSNTRVLSKRETLEPLRTKDVAMLFGNPIFQKAEKGNLSPLPGAEKEINEIQKFLESKGWKAEPYIQEVATERAVKSLNNPKVFHIATHGFFVEDEKVDQKEEALKEMGLRPAFDNTLLKSGLVMDFGGDLLANEKPMNFNKEDGLLTAYEAMNLSMEKTDLVVLSACETGRGDVGVGEGVYGLQRSLIVAGARTVIMSLFKVSDEATQKLMLKFYKEWIKSGDKRRSFIKAKREMKAEYKDPIFWGAFIMIGVD